MTELTELLQAIMDILTNPFILILSIIYGILTFIAPIYVYLTYHKTKLLNERIDNLEQQHKEIMRGIQLNYQKEDI